MDQELTSLVEALLPSGQTPLKIEKLFGEASYREYFRIQTGDQASFILMKLPAGRQSASEEITNYQGPKDELPFLNVARYLFDRHLPVPRVMGINQNEGLILLQDLGDESLEKLFKKSNQAMGLFFYQQAIDLLLDFQEAGENHPDPSCMAFKRSFDPTLLGWEFEHFLAYGIEDRLGIQIPQGKRSEMEKWGKELVDAIATIPYGLTHRDFQSRNLMLFGYRFYMIDFQDALMGPPQYDLVALLRDSYVELPAPSLEKLLEYYLTQRAGRKLKALDGKDFRRHFYEITLQRKLKDAGRFQYIHTVKKNPAFFPHVPNSLKYVRHAFGELPQYQPLQTLLGEFIPELG